MWIKSENETISDNLMKHVIILIYVFRYMHVYMQIIHHISAYELWKNESFPVSTFFEKIILYC